MKKFFKKTDGFTLVELIVVIAILGILAGVGTVGYSGYIKKANMAADQQLVSQVANALQLHYYADQNNAKSDYVVLNVNADAGVGDEGFADAAMKAAFGDEWKKATSLKYSEWTDTKMFDIAAGYDDEALQLIAGSSFVTHSSSKGVMSAVTGLTGLVGDVIREKSSDPEKAKSNLNLLFGEGNSVVTKLEELKIDGNDYPTAISNMLVNTMADTIETEPYLRGVINMYATAFAYAEATGDDAALKKMDETLGNFSMDMLTYEGTNADETYAAGYGTMLDGMTTFDGTDDVPLAEYKGFLDYLNTTGGEQINKDTEALSTMMGAVKTISGDFLDKESLTNPGLFSTGAVANQVDNYLSSVKALAGMSEQERTALDTALSDGSVGLFISVNGTVSVIPSAAWAKTD